MLRKCLLSAVTVTLAACSAGGAEPLEGTAPLTWDGDLASRMVDGIDRFLLGQIEASAAGRAAHWKRDFASSAAYNRSIEPNRKRLRQILGMRDARVAFEQLELLGTTGRRAVAARNERYQIAMVRWPTVGDLWAEGLLVEPREAPRADLIVIPDASQTPEQLVGLVAGLAPERQIARRLAESGCRVLVPDVVNREMQRRHGRANLTNREFLYRPAFELGRHLIGYELEAVLAGADWMDAEGKRRGQELPRGVAGWGEGGLLALYAAAVDPRFDVALVSGAFDSRADIWSEPIDRNVFGLLEQFGGAELAAMVAPRKLLIEAADWPQVDLPSEGGAPAQLRTPPLAAVRAEVERAAELLSEAPEAWSRPQLLAGGGPEAGAALGGPALAALAQALGVKELAPASAPADPAPAWRAPAQRQERLIRQYDRHNQWLLAESAAARDEFMSKLDTSSLEKYQETVEPYRDHFREEVVGRFDIPLLPPQPRTRQAFDEPKWTGYDVVLDVFPDVFAYGVLLMPKDIKPGERRPVVVCQHGLEGRPRDVIQGDHGAYHDYAAKLAERGFITFAPQNCYIFKDRFRTLQRKSYPLKRTLFSVIVPQHQQIVDWLATLPQVDPERIAFYGLSYGGKSAMRIPPLVTNYCLSICSADFNEWVWKNASTRAPHSYVWTGEYEIFEFDLGSTFNYAEMAALIAPRPFMVERGHFDGVAPDEAVGYEYAKVRRLYNARLKLDGRTEIEWFVGPHTINGQGTFRFLHKHLNWPQK